MIEPNIEETRLHVSQEAIIPVYREEAKQYFCEYTNPSRVSVDGHEIVTNYLKPGLVFSLLAIGQTKPLLECGICDVTDSIDPVISLEEIVFRFTRSGKRHTWIHKLANEKGEINPTAQYHYAPLDNYREMSLNYTASVQLYTEDLHEVDTVKVLAVGTVNMELGDTCVFFKVELENNVFENVEVVGYKLNARRVNHNRRPV